MSERDTRVGRGRARMPFRLAGAGRGVLLVAAPLGVTLWLAATGRLDLYIHPRYIVFTVIMCAIALVALVLGALARGDGHDHGLDDPLGDPLDGGEPVAAPPARGRALRSVLSGASVVVCAALAIALVVVPPTTLTSATAVQRAAAPVAPAAGAAPVDAHASTAGFTLKDWSALLAQTSDPSFYAGRSVDVTGFVVAGARGGSTFSLTRFVVTCCAVDAQPVSVPVLLPGWSDQYAADDWLHITGTFVADPSGGAAPIVLQPDSVTTMHEPDDPYLY
ncbi:TIGR03943 family protein [Galbitalea sp. SE-J8]|uniref:TIGR03943 family putative permease subunit n=1 Tax=Galbitalea sp. SE-J8 TaxID=3054952 RepID=UPI00259CAE85|nr:TIGR03943 family protein [Galbitalea sp. SE-J8]MDM4761694.1 TIGR03943 family protein [Galbitalea sp. SE-J8]